MVVMKDMCQASVIGASSTVVLPISGGNATAGYGRQPSTSQPAGEPLPSQPSVVCSPPAVAPVSAPASEPAVVPEPSAVVPEPVPAAGEPNSAAGEPPAATQEPATF